MRAFPLLGVCLGLFGIGGSVACSRELDSAAAAPKAPEPPLPAGAGEPLLIDEPASELTIPAQGVSLFFPGARGFVREDSVGSWTTLKHERTGATLSVRHRPARRTVTPAECEQEAGRSLRLLRQPLVEEVRERVFRTTDYFGTSVTGLAADRSGRVVVHTAGTARCLSLVFRDPNGREGLSLELVSEKFFPTVSALSVDDRAQRPLGPDL